MKCWNEIGDNALKYFNWENQLLSNKNIETKVDLSVFSINASMIFSTEDRKEFLSVCERKMKEIFNSEKILKDYKLYLFYNVGIDNPPTRIARYKKVWKTFQDRRMIQNFILGPEVEVNTSDRTYFTSIALFDIDSFQTALQLLSSRFQTCMIFGSKKENIFNEQYIKSLFDLSFGKNSKTNGLIDFFNVSINLCGENDLVFRWGDSSEDANIAIIANHEIIEHLNKFVS